MRRQAKATRWGACDQSLLEKRSLAPAESARVGSVLLRVVLRRRGELLAA